MTMARPYTPSTSLRLTTGTLALPPTSLRLPFRHGTRVVELPLSGIGKPACPPADEVVEVADADHGKGPRYLQLGRPWAESFRCVLTGSKIKGIKATLPRD